MLKFVWNLKLAFIFFIFLISFFETIVLFTLQTKTEHFCLVMENEEEEEEEKNVNFTAISKLHIALDIFEIELSF